MRPPRVKTMRVADAQRWHLDLDLDRCPNFDASGSITGMRKLYCGQKALLVRCGSYIYNVSRVPDIYERAH